MACYFWTKQDILSDFSNINFFYEYWMAFQNPENDKVLLLFLWKHLSAYLSIISFITCLSTETFYDFFIKTEKHMLSFLISNQINIKNDLSHTLIEYSCQISWFHDLEIWPVAFVVVNWTYQEGKPMQFIKSVEVYADVIKNIKVIKIKRQGQQIHTLKIISLALGHKIGQQKKAHLG